MNNLIMQNFVVAKDIQDYSKATWHKNPVSGNKDINNKQI